MILIFSNDKKIYLGGVEIFNEEFEALLNNNEIQFYRIQSITNIKIIDYPYRIVLSVLYILINFKKIDSILVQYGNFLDVLSLPFLKLSLKPIRIIVHVGISWKHIKNSITKKLTNLFLIYFAKQVYIITDEQSSFLTHNCIKKIHTIINKKYITEKTHRIENEKYLLFLGRICSEKGVDDLIDVYSNLNKIINLPNLNLVGPIKQSYKKRIYKLIDTYKLNNQISIINPVYNTEEKIKLIDDALLLIYPSYSDAFPLIVIESFSRGKCILASSISETKHFIEYDDFLFIPGDQNDLINKLKILVQNQKSFKKEIEYLQNKSMKYADGNIIKDIFE